MLPYGAAARRAVTAPAFVSSGAMSARGWPCTARSFASSGSMSCSSSVHGNGGSMSGSSSSCDMAISSWRNPGAVASALVAVFCRAQRRASVRYMETSESGCAGVRRGVAVVTCAQVVRFLIPAPGPPGGSRPARLREDVHLLWTAFVGRDPADDTAANARAAAVAAARDRWG